MKNLFAVLILAFAIIPQAKANGGGIFVGSNAVGIFPAQAQFVTDGFGNLVAVNNGFTPQLSFFNAGFVSPFVGVRAAPFVAFNAGGFRSATIIRRGPFGGAVIRQRIFP